MWPLRFGGPADGTAARMTGLLERRTRNTAHVWPLGPTFPDVSDYRARGLLA